MKSEYILSIKFHFIVIFIAIGLSAIFIINIYWIIKGYKYISSYLKNYEMFKDYYFKIIDPKKFQKEKFIDEVKKRHPSFNIDPDVNEFKEEKTILKMRNEMWSLYLLDTRELGTRRIYCHIGPIINDEDRDILTDFDSILSKYAIMIYE